MELDVKLAGTLGSGTGEHTAGKNGLGITGFGIGRSGAGIGKTGKERIRKELADRGRTSMMEEIRKEVAKEVVKEVKEEVREEVSREEVRKDTGNEVRKEVRKEVREESGKELRENSEVRIEARGQVNPPAAGNKASDRPEAAATGMDMQKASGIKRTDPRQEPQGTCIRRICCKRYKRNRKMWKPLSGTVPKKNSAL